MSEQIQKEKSTEKAEEKPNDGDAKGLSPASQASVDAATEGIDDLLADIDKVLEPNAQAFVNSFVQRGGQ
jgi:ubiquitin-like protein Pup